MKETSFGFMSTLEVDNALVEYLEFYKSGRKHKHSQKEVFKVLSGQGFLYRDGEVVNLIEGGVYSVMEDVEHYMRPEEGKLLKLILSYEKKDSSAEAYSGVDVSIL